MKKLLNYICLLILYTAGFQSIAQDQYPDSRKTEQTDNYFGNKVADPYRWLENTNEPETRDWVRRQNIFTRDYFSGISSRQVIYKKLEKLQNFTRYESPFINNGYYYFYKNTGLQNQPVLYRQKGLKEEPEIFLDPNKFSIDGTVALSTVSISKDGKYCAYSISKNGSDWNDAFVMDVSSKKMLADKIEWLKFSSLSWYKEEGFYYSRYPAPEASQKWSGQNKYHSVYFHKIGSPQSADSLVYEDREHPFRHHFASVTEDNNFLILYVSEGSNNRQILLKNLNGGKKAVFKMILEGFKYEARVIDNDNKFLYLRTNANAPNYRVVSASIVNPYINNWETVIPEKKELLKSVNTAGGYWFVTYSNNGGNRLFQYTGAYQMKELDIPAFHETIAYQGQREDGDFFYSYSSFIHPPVLYRLGIRNGKSTIFMPGGLMADSSIIETKQLMYTNRDGVKIPIVLSFKKGTKMDGNNPVLLFGNGGYNPAETSRFNILNRFFLSQNGICVQAGLRAGAKNGDDGYMTESVYGKQNAINNFIDAALFLVKEKYSNASKMAIAGGGNEAMMVGAFIAQRPELVKVALPDVGVFDMLRYQKFTTGASWIPEYGSSDDPEHFDNLYSYSPLHNLKKGTKYPATLITTADHDDRVVPAHSYKFAARLQEVQTGPNPILLRIEESAGHGEGKPIAKKLDEMADIMSFTMENLGMEMK